MEFHRGFLLAKPARQINFLEVVEAIEGSLAINRYLNDDYQCECGSTCSVEEVWNRAQ